MKIWKEDIFGKGKCTAKEFLAEEDSLEGWHPPWNVKGLRVPGGSDGFFRTYNAIISASMVE